MCCTLETAKLSKTILYAGDTTIDGQYRHVLGYQNKAENLSTGPNAMILPFPSAERMGPENVIDVGENKTILTDMAEAIKHRTRRRDRRMESLGYDDDLIGSYVEVFNSGDYTVVLAADARDIPQVLNRVPENKRPRINREIFEAYAKWYPNWPIALCCFEAQKSVENQPMLWWYLPTSHDTLFLPGLDGHSGQVPNLKEKVGREHSIVVGTTAQIKSKGSKVRYGSDLSSDLKKFIPEYVVGGEVHLTTPNGDFQVRAAEVHEARYSFDIVSPPGS